MKKRLLALALCLALAMSLLPVTAFALTDDDIVGIQDQGVYCVGTYFTVNQSVASSVISVQDEIEGVVIDPDGNGRYKLPGDSGNPQIKFTFFDEFGNPNTMVFSVYLRDHDWQFTQKENSLTATCQNQLDSQCPIGQISLTLDAHSVTLPNSPFNARLEGLEQFKAAIPNAVIGEFVYKYKGPGDSEYRIVEPTAANAKAGQYQVGVRIKNLPGAVEQKGPVAMAYEGNQDNTGYADLYVQYTAADPAITAQTGDNRPIELMMASTAVFSALAAAAFVLDHKRRYSR